MAGSETVTGSQVRVLGVDGGGTSVVARVADETGRCLGEGRGGSGNYQAVGVEAARAVLDEAIGGALGVAGVAPEDIAAAAYGMAGADRPADFANIEAYLPALPGKRVLVNDAQLVLRAGTDDGVGVALISGTGSNNLGVNAEGRLHRVGGYCFELGDLGSASDLGAEAVRLAQRGEDGRGEPTKLYGLLCAGLGLERLEDIVDLWIEDDPRADSFGWAAPLVFEAASANDSVARGILERAGEEFVLCGRMIIEELFDEGATVPVVLGGSVLQFGADPTLVRTIERGLTALPQQVDVRRLEGAPVEGAVRLALDRLASR